MKPEYGVKVLINTHVRSKRGDAYDAPLYRYASLHADMDDLETYKKAMLSLKGKYQDELHKTDSAFNEHYLNEKIESLTKKIQAIEHCINALEEETV